MDFAIVYLGWRFIYRIADFFRHWYADGSRAFARYFAATKMAVRPSLPASIKAVAYALIALVFAVAYVVWLAIPAVTILYAAKNI